VRGLILQMIIADETDAVAMAKWEHYRLVRMSKRWHGTIAQAENDPSQEQPNRRKTLGINHLPTNQGVFVGSCASVVQMLDETATVPGVCGVMLTFDDFVIGMEQFAPVFCR
jgi:pyrimidine oxygenase